MPIIVWPIGVDLLYQMPTQPMTTLVLPEVTGAVPIVYTLTLLGLPLGFYFDLPTRTISDIPLRWTSGSLTY